MKHFPVMMAEVLGALDPKDAEIFVDGTFGAGGYTRAVLGAVPRAAGGCSVYAIDRDPDALVRARVVAADFPDHFFILPGCFGQMDALLAQVGVGLVDGIMLDIGVSSFQLDEAERGFSFMQDGPLDMRMGQEGLSAADVVNQFSEEDIANIIYEFGEERASRRIAAAIVRQREEEPFTRTHELASLVERVLGRPPVKKGKKATHPATRTFQALRIFVNDELGELRRGLEAAERLLKEGGRLVVVSFHSLEDRIVKNFMAERSGRVPSGSRHQPQAAVEKADPTFRLYKKSAIKASDAEMKQNPRARSSRLRVAVRTKTPATSKNLATADVLAQGGMPDA